MCAAVVCTPSVEQVFHADGNAGRWLPVTRRARRVRRVGSLQRQFGRLDDIKRLMRARLPPPIEGARHFARGKLPSATPSRISATVRSVRLVIIRSPSARRRSRVPPAGVRQHLVAHIAAGQRIGVHYVAAQAEMVGDHGGHWLYAGHPPAQVARPIRGCCWFGNQPFGLIIVRNGDAREAGDFL